MNGKKWTQEEIEIIKTEYLNGIKFLMNKIPYRSRSSIKNKATELKLKWDKKISKRKYSMDYIEIIKDVVKSSYSYTEVLRNLNKSKSGDSIKIIKRVILENNISIEHFDSWKNNRVNNGTHKPIEFYLNVGTNIQSNKLKFKLYENGMKERICELCGQGEEWNGKKMALILDHINGINNDNRIENLRIVCPNCNATLETHCRGHKKLECNDTAT